MCDLVRCLRQASIAALTRQLEEARRAAERDIAAAVAETKARCAADMQAAAMEAERALTRAREEAATSAAERERQQGEEGAWVFVAHFVPHVLAPHALAPCVLGGALGLLVVGCKVVHVCEAEPGMAHALRWCWGGVDGKGGGGGAGWSALGEAYEGVHVVRELYH